MEYSSIPVPMGRQCYCSIYSRQITIATWRCCRFFSIQCGLPPGLSIFCHGGELQIPRFGGVGAAQLLDARAPGLADALWSWEDPLCFPDGSRTGCSVGNRPARVPPAEAAPHFIKCGTVPESSCHPDFSPRNAERAPAYIQHALRQGVSRHRIGALLPRASS